MEFQYPYESPVPEQRPQRPEPIDLVALMEESLRIERTHTWLYGTFDVRCTVCRAQKGTLAATKPCPGLLGMPYDDFLSLSDAVGV